MVKTDLWLLRIRSSSNHIVRICFPKVIIHFKSTKEGTIEDVGGPVEFLDRFPSCEGTKPVRYRAFLLIC